MSEVQAETKSKFSKLGILGLAIFAMGCAVFIYDELPYVQLLLTGHFKELSQGTKHLIADNIMILDGVVTLAGSVVLFREEYKK